MNDKLSDEELRNIILNVLRIENVDEIKQYSPKLKKQMIKKLENIKGTSYHQISRVIGINRKMVERYIKG